jgi:tetratricopeptide (TPR) repeat protein
MSAADASEFLITRAGDIGIHLEPSPSLTRLAERLDRLPLAMQLAVARLRLFSVDQLLERLSTALDLAGDRDLDPRQRTLRATIAWSYDLLDDDERALLRRMSVFAGGGTLEAVEAICEADPEVLLSLIDKSLVRRSDDAPEPRFWLLETIREFAHERLQEAGEMSTLAVAHASWYARWARQLDEEVHDVASRAPYLQRYDVELDNVRAALSWSASAGRDDLLMALAGNLRMEFHMRGLYREGRRWLELAASRPGGEPIDRMRVADGISSLAYRQGEYDVSLRWAEQGLALAREVGTDAEVLTLVTDLADALSAVGRADESVAAFDEAVAIARDLGTPPRIASALVNRADTAAVSGRYGEALQLLEEALAFAREHDIRNATVVATVDLASTSFMVGRDEDAERYARDIGRVEEVSDIEEIALLVLAGTAARRGDLERAAFLLGASDGLRALNGYEFEPAEKAVEDVVRSLLADALATPAGQRRYGEGRALDVATAKALVDA